MGFDLSQPVPLLILGDGPDQKTGLGRIGHDLAWLLSGMPEFKVGYLGRLGFGRSKYPWTSYSFSEREQWGEKRLEEAWRDLSGGVKGIVFTIWDASRLLWLADPREMPVSFQSMIAQGEFERWGYFMIDGAGANPGKLPLEQDHVLERFERVLVASKWAWELARKSRADVDWLPHGINTECFQPVERDLARSVWGVEKQDVVVGCVMANQARKHWPVVMEAVARMPGKSYLWLHTDSMLNYWDLTALAVEYGLAERIFLDNRSLSDRELAMRYSGCDVSVVVSGGEGFCYPVAESLACGCPVVVGEYGAQRELPGIGVPVAYSTLETSHNVRRAHYDPRAVAGALQSALKWGREAARGRVEHLEWKKLSVQWRKWVRSGLGEVNARQERARGFCS